MHENLICQQSGRKVLLTSNKNTSYLAKWVQLHFVEHSNRRKMQSYSMRRKNSISAIIFIWLSFVANNIFVVWLGRFALFAK